MKKVLLGLFFAMFALQVNAATVVTESSFDTLSETGAPFSVDGLDFTLDTDGTATELKLTFSFHDQVLNTVSNFGAELRDSSDNVLKTVMATAGSGVGSMVLLLGDYNIHFLGTEGGEGAAVTLSASAVPVPAAVWLFGSAIMGLFGASRRKSSTVVA